MTKFNHYSFIIFILLAFSCSDNKTNKNKLEVVSNLLKAGDTKKADSIFATVIYSSTIDHDYKLMQVALDFKKGHFEKALLNSNDFIEKYPKSSFGYYYAGLSEFNMKKYKNAEKLFVQSLDSYKRSPDGSSIYLEKNSSKYLFDQNSIYDDLIFMIGLSKNSLGYYKTAISFMEDCLGKQYRKAETLIVIGDCYFNLGDKDLAKNYFMQAKQEGSPDADYYLKKY
ncbi:tetratricopeptide repeat protein [Ferruginibacter profundus]